MVSKCWGSDMVEVPIYDLPPGAGWYWTDKKCEEDATEIIFQGNGFCPRHLVEFGLACEWPKKEQS